jgi:uncharacterized protein YggE
LTGQSYEPDERAGREETRLSEVEISVRGSNTREVPPERADVRIHVGTDGPVPDDVAARTASAAAEVRSTIEPLLDPATGPVTGWSSGGVRTWSERPWNQEGGQLPFVHHAQQSFEVEFADFVAMARWLGQVGSLDGASVDGVAWTLTDERRDVVLAEVRTAAVRDARTKAESYARALGLGDVTPVAIADAGLLAGAPPGGPAPMAMAARMKDAGPSFELNPHGLQITAEVEARFVARPSIGA